MSEKASNLEESESLPSGKKLCRRFNYLPNDKILNWSKLKAFIDYKFKIARNNGFCLLKSRKRQKRRECLKLWGRVKV